MFVGENTGGGAFFTFSNDNVPVDGNDVSAFKVWTLSSMIDGTVDEDTLEVTCKGSENEKRVRHRETENRWQRQHNCYFDHHTHKKKKKREKEREREREVP